MSAESFFSQALLRATDDDNEERKNLYNGLIVLTKEIIAIRSEIQNLADAVRSLKK